jgi:6-phosphogluconolactonase
MSVSVEVLTDADAVARRAAELFVTDMRSALVSEVPALWVAAGGTTPALAYDILASEHRDDVAWNRVAIAMGDERCVPRDHIDSNWRQLTERLLSKVGVDPERLAVPLGDGSVEERAEAYRDRLAEVAGVASGPPAIAQAWVGMGEDGHTLSLFPNHPSSEETSEYVIAVHDSPKPPPDRITLTRAALRECKSLVILSAGAGKQEAVQRALEPESNLPIASLARAVVEGGGNVTWLLDKSAAARLS